VALPVSAPFHCSLMSAAADQMKPALDKTDFKEPVIEVISNVTGRPVSSKLLLLLLFFFQGVPV
jgi:[acyl-carrier-protein] S-malonyltransferase